MQNAGPFLLNTTGAGRTITLQFNAPTLTPAFEVRLTVMHAARLVIGGRGGLC